MTSLSDSLLGKTEFQEQPEHMGRMQLIRIAYAAKECLEQWAQGRGKPARLTTEERKLRDELSITLEIFGD